MDWSKERLDLERCPRWRWQEVCILTTVLRPVLIMLIAEDFHFETTKHTEIQSHL